MSTEWSKVGESVIITRDASGRNGVWYMIDPISRSKVGMIVSEAGKFIAYDWNTDIKAFGEDFRSAALNLYEKLGLSITVLTDPKLSKTEVGKERRSDDEPLDFNSL